MKSYAANEKWTRFHNAAAQRVFASDLEKVKLPFAKFDSKLRQMRNVVEGTIV